MSAEEERDLALDNQLLAQIFPRAKSVSTKVLAQTFETCTFVAYPEVSSEEESTETLVRLEISPSKIAAVSALQQSASLAIPDLIPQVYEIGTASTEDGRKVDYSVTAFVRDAVTLESIWDELDDDQVAHVVEQVVSVVSKLQSIDLLDEDVQRLVTSGGGTAGTPIEPIIPLGGLQVGFFTTATNLIRSLVAAQDDFDQITITQDPGDTSVRFTTPFSDIGPVSLSQTAIDALQKSVVLCHNDLEPRNVLVQPVSRVADAGHDADTETQPASYEVVAIIDWEMAGFFPFAYEFFYKDLVLGSANLYYSWYRAFKERAARLLPSGAEAEGSEALFQALDLILRARGRVETRNVGMLMQRRWIEREKVVRGALWEGWVRDSKAGSVKKFTEDDNEELELGVLRELGYIS
ncbi:uncharacterized protein BJX67DRAFT_378794 [Aspergillus lucknowensis]|uniref:Aminoglycoside phosphotransferase domain-containing protein n=1 Tax=Aspergillus lucknowensis TaxID=176173 RepID=A0ABR4LYX8_9EURO